MDKLKKALKVIGILLAVVGVIWFCLPIKRHGFGLGSVFGICICLMLIFLILFYKKIADKGKKRKIFMRVITVLYVLGIAWCTYLTVQMNSVQSKTPPENTNIILLGAQVYTEDRISLSLRGRVDKAAKYLEENPEAICIATGGQGGDEPVTEAYAEKKALLKLGIAEDRIYLEDESHNTRENMENSLEIAQRENLGNEFGIVTQGFHMFRAMKLAESVGITPYAVTSNTDFYMFPSYYGRELLSLTKWHIEQIFR